MNETREWDGLKGCGQEEEEEVLGCFGEECKGWLEVRDEINT